MTTAHDDDAGLTDDVSFDVTHPTPTSGPIVADRVPRFGITRSRDGKWSDHIVAENGKITWTTQTFTTLSYAEDALFLLVDEVDRILGALVGLPDVTQIPYTLTMGSGKSKTVETRIARR